MEPEDELWLLESKLRLLDSVSEHLKKRINKIGKSEKRVKGEVEGFCRHHSAFPQ